METTSRSGSRSIYIIESSLAQSTCSVDATKVDLSRSDPDRVCSEDRPLDSEWFPRELNEKADHLSQIIDLNDWLFNSIIFQCG